MKTVKTLFIVALACLVLVSCDDDPEPSENPPNSTSNQTETSQGSNNSGNTGNDNITNNGNEENQPPGMAEDDFNEYLKKWTSNRYDCDSKFRLTYLSDELLDAWYEFETSTSVRSDITRLKNIDDKYIFLLSIAPTWSDTVDLYPVDNNIKLYLTDTTGSFHYVSEYTGNINQLLEGESSAFGSYVWYHSCITFDAIPDKYAFKVVKINFWDETGDYGEVQHTFTVAGTPEDERSNGSIDVMGILDMFFTILQFL